MATVHEYNRAHCGVPDILRDRVFADFRLWGSAAQQTLLAEAKDKATAFSQGTLEKPWLLLLGPPGVGKTHLMVAATMTLVGQGVNAVYVKAVDLARCLRANDREAADSYRYAKVLLLDDALAEYQTEFSIQGFEELLDYRYTERGPTCISTNADLGAFSLRLQSRMEEIGDFVLLADVQDYRRRG